MGCGWAREGIQGGTARGCNKPAFNIVFKEERSNVFLVLCCLPVFLLGVAFLSGEKAVLLLTFCYSAVLWSTSFLVTAGLVGGKD